MEFTKSASPPADSNTRTHEKREHHSSTHHRQEEGKVAEDAMRRSRSLSPSAPTQHGTGERSTTSQRKHIRDAEAGGRGGLAETPPAQPTSPSHRRDSRTSKSDDRGEHRHHHHRSSASTSGSIGSPSARGSRRSRHDGEEDEKDSVKSSSHAGHHHHHHRGHARSNKSDDGESTIGCHGDDSIGTTASRSPTSRSVAPGSPRNGGEKRQHMSGASLSPRLLHHDNSSGHSEVGSSRSHGKGHGGSARDAPSPQTHSSSSGHRDKGTDERSMSRDEGIAASEDHYRHGSNTGGRQVLTEEGNYSPSSSARHDRHASGQPRDHHSLSSASDRTVAAREEHAKEIGTTSSRSRSPLGEHRHSHGHSTTMHHEENFTTTMGGAKHSQHHGSSDNHDRWGAISEKSSHHERSHHDASRHDASRKDRSDPHQRHSVENDRDAGVPSSTGSRYHKSSSDRGRSSTSGEGDAEGHRVPGKSTSPGFSSEHAHGGTGSRSHRSHVSRSEERDRSPHHRHHSGSSSVLGDDTGSRGHRSHDSSFDNHHSHHGGSRTSHGVDSRDDGDSAKVTEGSRHRLRDEERDHHSEHGSTSGRYGHSHGSSSSSVSSRRDHDYGQERDIHSEHGTTNGRHRHSNSSSTSCNISSRRDPYHGQERDNQSEHGSTSGRHRHSSSSSSGNISSCRHHDHGHHSPHRGEESDRRRHGEYDSPGHHRSDHRHSSHHQSSSDSHHGNNDSHRAPRDEGLHRQQTTSYSTKDEGILASTGGCEHHHRSSSSSSSRVGRSSSESSPNPPRPNISGSRSSSKDHDHGSGGGGRRDDRERDSHYRHHFSSPTTRHNNNNDDDDGDSSRGNRGNLHSAREPGNDDDDSSRGSRGHRHSAHEHHHHHHHHDDRPLSSSSGDGVRSSSHHHHAHDSDERSRPSYASLRIDTTTKGHNDSSAISGVGDGGSRRLVSSLGRSGDGARVGGRDHRVRFHLDGASSDAARADEAHGQRAAAAAAASLMSHEDGMPADDVDTGVFTGLHLACLNGSVSHARRELSSGANVNAPAAGDGDGATPLQLACRRGSEEVVHLLLSKTADVSLADHHGTSALHYAAAGGHETIVARLLASGGAADQVDSRGRTPLHDACDGTNANDGASTTTSSNTTASPRKAAVHGGELNKATHRGNDRGGRLHLARLLVNAGADPGVGVRKPGGDGGGRTTGDGVPRSSRLLYLDRNKLKRGEDSDAGMTPLHLSCRSGEAEVATYLIRAGASVNAVDDNGFIPGEAFSPWVSSEKRRDVREVLQPARAKEEARELRTAVESLTKKMQSNDAQVVALVSENRVLEERLQLQENRNAGYTRQIAALEEEAKKHGKALEAGAQRESAFREESAELTKETRGLGRGVRELVETSPQLRQEVGRLSTRVDACRVDREVVADLSRRLGACEDRLETRLADLGTRLERVERARSVSEPCSCSGRVEAIAAKVGALVGGQGASLRRLDDLASDVSGALRSVKQSEAASAAKLDLQAHELGALVERRVSQLRSEVDVQLARAWQLVGRGSSMGSMGGLAAAGEGAALARSSMDLGAREGGGGARVFTDLVLALQLKVGELDCDIFKLREQVYTWERTVSGSAAPSPTSPCRPSHHNNSYHHVSPTHHAGGQPQSVPSTTCYTGHWGDHRYCSGTSCCCDRAGFESDSTFFENSSIPRPVVNATTAAGRKSGGHVCCSTRRRRRRRSGSNGWEEAGGGEEVERRLSALEEAIF